MKVISTMKCNTTLESQQLEKRTSPVRLVLSRLSNVAKLSRGWSALCPSHDDNMNSLSIDEGADGRALLYCHAGCSYKDVANALGISVRDLFVQKRGRK
jgi:hypothetical protein